MGTSLVNAHTAFSVVVFQFRMLFQEFMLEAEGKLDRWPSGHHRQGDVHYRGTLFS